MDLGLIILAGGYSSRMGKDKARIKWNGKTFIEDLLDKAKVYGFTEKIVVTNSEEAFYQNLPASVISDIYPHLGPLSGLHAGLKKSGCLWNFVISCDMPLFDFSVVDTLKQNISNDYFVVVPSLDGRYQQLAALYRKDCDTVIEELLLSGQQRLRDLFLKRAVLKIEMDIWQNLFFNVNTPAELRIARAKAVNAARKIPVVSIVASRSGTGKTTFICSLLPALKSLGLKVAVVKSDGHGFDLDQEGKDTWEFSKAGAAGVAIVSPQGYAIMQRTIEKEPLENIVDKISDVDLILVESRRHGIFPILEIEREGYTSELLTVKADLAAVLTDSARSLAPANVKKLSLNDPKKAADFISTLW